MIPSASILLKSAQVLCLGALIDASSGVEGGNNVVLTCLINGDDAVITNRTKATNAEILSHK